MTNEAAETIRNARGIFARRAIKQRIKKEKEEAWVGEVRGDVVVAA